MTAAADLPPGDKPTLDPQARRVLGAAFLVSVYGVLTLVFLGVALYFAIAEKQPITSPRVFVAAIGALYMGFRAWMIYSKNKGPGGKSNAR